MNIKVYTGNTCAYCKRVKQHLQEAGIEYEERNTSENREAKKELISMGLMSVPVVEVDGEVIVGYDKGKMDKLVEKYRQA